MSSPTTVETCAECSFVACICSGPEILRARPTIEHPYRAAPRPVRRLAPPRRAPLPSRAGQARRLTIDWGARFGSDHADIHTQHGPIGAIDLSIHGWDMSLGAKSSYIAVSSRGLRCRLARGTVHAQFQKSSWYRVDGAVISYPAVIRGRAEVRLGAGLVSLPLTDGMIACKFRTEPGVIEVEATAWVEAAFAVFFALVTRELAKQQGWLDVGRPSGGR